MVFGLADLTGSFSGSGGDYDTGYQNMEDFIQQHQLTYPILIEDDNDSGRTPYGVGAYPNYPHFGSSGEW